MDAVKSIRVPASLLRAVRHRARREGLDESTAMRQLMAMGAREYATDLYREGRITLREAAGLAGMPVREMLDFLFERGVRGNVTADQARSGLEDLLRAGERERPRARKRAGLSKASSPSG